MVTIEQLDFFRRERTTEELLKEFGNVSGTNMLKEVIEEGFVNSEGKKFKLDESGRKKLEELKEIERKERKILLLKHPLLTGIILVLLTAFLTYLITINSIDYENELSVRFIGENTITVPPNQTIDFNGITVYNPTGKKVSLKDMYIERSNNWINYQPISPNQKETKEDIGITYNIPTLVNDYAPYMALESGETKLMLGQFKLSAPYKEGRYELNFYVETLDGKKYYIDRKLIVNVVEEK